MRSKRYYGTPMGKLKKRQHNGKRCRRHGRKEPKPDSMGGREEKRVSTDLPGIEAYGAMGEPEPEGPRPAEEPDGSGKETGDMKRQEHEQGPEGREEPQEAPERSAMRGLEADAGLGEPEGPRPGEEPEESREEPHEGGRDGQGQSVDPGGEPKEETLKPEMRGLRFDEGMVQYLRMVTSLIEGRRVGRDEILAMLERKVSHRSIGRERWIDYVMRFLKEKPP